MSGKFQVGDIVVFDESYFSHYYSSREPAKPMLVMKTPPLGSKISVAYVLPIGETESFPVYMKYLKKIE
jgi:hypothetical protein